MNIAEYRQKIEASVAAALDEDSAAPEVATRGVAAAGSAATARVMPLKDPAARKRAAAIVGDGNESLETRLTALTAIRGQVAGNEAQIDLLLDRLRDRSEDPALRRAALSVLRQASFQAARFRAKRPEFLDVLRGLVDDDDAELRDEAIEILAQERDEFVQRRLIEGLEKPADALVSPERALQLMGFDSHAEHHAMLRKLIEAPPNQATKREAVRLLGADAESRPLLTRIFRDRGEDAETRSISAVALQSVAPETFKTEAQEVVLDESEDDELRAVSLSALAHASADRPGGQTRGAEIRIAGARGQEEGFERAVRALRGKGSSQLEKALAAYLKEAAPGSGRR